MLLFNDECIFLQLDGKSAKEVIYLLGGVLERLGAVSSQFAGLAYKREQKYPTGLPAQPFALAIPHTNCEEVYQPALAFASLKEPIFFGSMENHAIDLPVSMVLLMANNKPVDHIRMLRRVTRIARDAKKMIELFNLPSAPAAAAWLRRELKLNPPDSG